MPVVRHSDTSRYIYIAELDCPASRTNYKVRLSQTTGGCERISILEMAAPLDQRIKVPIDDPNADTEWYVASGQC